MALKKRNPSLRIKKEQTRPGAPVNELGGTKKSERKISGRKPKDRLREIKHSGTFKLL